jgi:cytoskeletal protein CcmA (bactofilin family)
LKLGRKFRSDEFKGFLDEGTALTGELSFSGTLRADGNVHGSIKTSDILIVGERASIHADITAGEVQIHGSVSGDIEGSRRVNIFATGRVRGDIRTPQLVVEEGGRFDGRSRSTSGDSEESSTPHPASEASTAQNE